MKNNNGSQVSPGVNGQIMESHGISEGEMLLQVREWIKRLKKHLELFVMEGVVKPATR